MNAENLMTDDTKNNRVINITPEMIEAGLSKMWNYEDYVFEDVRREALINIYTAMERARNRQEG